MLGASSHQPKTPEAGKPKLRSHQPQPTEAGYRKTEEHDQEQKSVNDEIQHFFCCDDSGGELIAVDAGSREFFIFGHIPADCCFDESVGFTSWWDTDFVVGEFWESDSLFFEQFSKGLDESVVTAVSGCGFGERDSIEFDGDGSFWEGLHTGFDLVIGDMDSSADRGTEDAGDDERQVGGGDLFFLIAESYDFLQDFCTDIGIEFSHADCLEVLIEGSLSGEFSEGVVAFSSEAFGEESICVEVSFFIAVCVDAAGLSEDIASDDGSVPCVAFSGDGLNHHGSVLEFFFHDASCPIGMIVDGHDELSEGLVSGSFPESVYGDMNASDAGFDSGEAVGGHETVIIVSMEIQEGVGHDGIDPVEIFCDLIRSKDSERIREHDAFDIHGGERLQEFVQISEGMQHSVGPVFQIDIDFQTDFSGIFDFSADIVEMLSRLFFELDAAMIFGTLRQEIEYGSAAFMNPVCGFSPVDESEDFHSVETPFMFRPFEDGGQSGFLPVGDPCGADFEPVDMQVGNEKTGDLEFFRGSVSDAGSLFAVAQRGVKNLNITVVSVLCFHFYLLSWYMV